MAKHLNPKSIDPDKYWYDKGFDDALLGIRPRNRMKRYLKGYRDGKHYQETREKYFPEERKSNAGEGRSFTFHGGFSSKLAAKKKEARTPGSFIEEKDGRYYVLKPKPKHLRTRFNPPVRGAVRIYEQAIRIEARKKHPHAYGGKLTKAGQRYFHDFETKNAEIWGLPDGSLLIRSRKQ